MGKIGAIFGKRSENISGEFTVEAPSGPQNLNTPYAPQSAAHASVETTAIRDEVPQEVQDYVQHYYELIRQEDACQRVGTGSWLRRTAGPVPSTRQRAAARCPVTTSFIGT